MVICLPCLLRSPKWRTGNRGGTMSCGRRKSSGTFPSMLIRCTILSAAVCPSNASGKLHSKSTLQETNWGNFILGNGAAAGRSCVNIVSLAGTLLQLLLSQRFHRDAVDWFPIGISSEHRSLQTKKTCCGSSIQWLWLGQDQQMGDTTSACSGIRWAPFSQNTSTTGPRTVATSTATSIVLAVPPNAMSGIIGHKFTDPNCPAKNIAIILDQYLL